MSRINAVKFSLGTLEDLNFGEIEVAFRRLLEHCVRDCVDRPLVKAGRKVTLQMVVKPIPIVRGATVDCESTSGVFQMRAKVPDFETSEINFGVKQDGSLVFNRDCPENFRQQSLLAEEADEE